MGWTGIADAVRAENWGRGWVQACETPGYWGLPVADAAVGGGFAWQDGYAAYSVSPPRAEKAIRYAEFPHEHHRVRSFEEEYLEFLKEGGIEYEERFVFEPGGSARGRGDSSDASRG